MKHLLIATLCGVALSCSKKDAHLNDTLTIDGTQSNKVLLYLNFSGETVREPLWATTPILAAASGLTPQTQHDIIREVAAHFSMFGTVAVTNDAALYSAFPADKRIRVVVTETALDGTEAGGVAIIGSFGMPGNIPCFVFSKRLNHYPPLIARAVSHEVGHAFGLFHQSYYTPECQLVDEYHRGTHEAGVIMGDIYTTNRKAAWWTGPTKLGCTMLQDDAAVIRSKVR